MAARAGSLRRSSRPWSSALGTRPHAHRFRTADTAADDPRIWTPAHGPTIPARQDPGNRSARGRHLHDPVTAAAGQLGPHVANHLEARRHVLQNFGHVIAQMTKFAATAWALRIGSMDVDFTGQMLGQWLAAYGCTWARLGWWWRGQCGLADLQLFERQLQLVEHAIELLGTPTELHAPQLGDHQFQVLDFPRWAVTKAFKAWMSSGRKSVAQVMARCYWCSQALNIRLLVPVRCAAVGANRCPPTASRVVPSSRRRCRWWLAARRSAPVQAACRTGTSHRHPTTAI